MCLLLGKEHLINGSCTVRSIFNERWGCSTASEIRHTPRKRRMLKEMMKFTILAIITLQLMAVSGEQHVCIFKKPRSILELNQSATLNLTCESRPSSSSSQHEFEWYRSKNGIQLPLRNSYRVPGKPLSVLTIRNTSRLDSGTYKCVCINKDANGSRSSDNAEVTLYVRVPPHIVPPKNPSLVVQDTNNCLLTCDVNGYPKPEVKWLRNDKRIRCIWGTVYECFPRNAPTSLKLIAVELKDSGIYRCEAKNAYGLASIEYKVRVRVGPPYFAGENTTIYERKGQNVTLQCDFSKAVMAETEFSWIFGHLIITKSTVGGKYQMKAKQIKDTDLQSFLHIYDLSDDDYGDYRCEISTIDNDRVMGFVSLQLQQGKKVSPEKIPRGNGKLLKIALLLTVGCLAVAVVLVVVLYRMYRKKRWLLKYYDYSCLEKYSYDVFITYSGKDNEWIVKELLPCLEDNKVRYCIHNRDFELGKSIMDNMAESVYKSRKVLAVMSKNYIVSKFCRDELEMALYRSAEQGDSSVIVLKIDDIEHRKIPKSLRNKTYLDFADAREKNTWKKRLLKEIKFFPEKGKHDPSLKRH